MDLRSFTIRRDYLATAVVLSGLVNLVVACSSTTAAPPPSAKGAANGNGAVYSSGGGDEVEVVEDPTTSSEKGSGGGGMWDSLDPNCKTKDSCPSAKPGLLLQGSSNGNQLAGQQGTRLSWRLNAVDQAQPTRRLAIFLKGLPSGFNTEPPHNQKITNELQLSYTPPEAATGVIEVFVRDYDRCLVTETEKASCLSTVFNQAYDFRQPDLQFQFQGTSSANQCPPKKGLFEQTLPGC